VPIKDIAAIKQQKNFNRDNLRRCVMVLIVSVFCTLMLLAGIFYQMLTKPAAAYYASNAAGAGFITRLTPLNKPNDSATALLKPDAVDEIGGVKKIPKK